MDQEMKPAAMMEAVQSPDHPHHHFALGQLLGTIAAGVLIWQSQGTGAVLSPQTLAQLIGGVLSSFSAPGATSAIQSDTPKL